MQQSVCSASRASLTTGCRPDTTGVDYPYTPWFNDVFRKEHPTIVDHFTQNGYYTRILDAVDELGLKDSTVIMFWSDHGYHLGDHGHWAKSTCYEWSTRSPLIVSIPGMKEAGKQTTALVEYVDMYPTLCEIAGIPKPTWLEGSSFKPLLSDSKQTWKRAAFSQFPRGKVEGYTVRTADYRYTKWLDKKSRKLVSEEFYDNRKDLRESLNIIANPVYSQQIKNLRRILNEGWKKSLPPGYTTSAYLSKGDDSYYSLSKKQKKRLSKKIVTPS